MRSAVIGAGTMGVGIAYEMCAAGIETQLVDLDLARANEGVQRVADVVDRAVSKGRLSPEEADSMLRLLAAGGPGDIESGLEVIVEAVPEHVHLKLRVLEEAEASGPHLLATNTSSISVERLSQALARPERFVGLHFFNPVWSMPLVEVVVAGQTSAETLARASSLVERLGKEPLVVRDSPGFATSRLGIALGLEAIRMVDEGVADAAAIDRAMELGYRHPLGPLRLSDLVGLDVRLDIARNLERELGSRFAPPSLLLEKVAQGHLGKKTGLGFYRWPTP